MHDIPGYVAAILIGVALGLIGAVHDASTNGLKEYYKKHRVKSEEQRAKSMVIFRAVTAAFSDSMTRKVGEVIDEDRP